MSILIPYTKIKPISTTHTTTKSISTPRRKPSHFRPVLFFVLYIWVHVHVIQKQYVPHKYEYQLVLTCPCYSKNPNVLRKCMTIFYILLHGIFTTTWYVLYDGRTSLRSIPPVRIISWCHLKVGTVYERTTYCEYHQYMGQYRIAHINSVPPRPNYWVCPGSHPSPTFLYTAWNDLADPTPAPHITRFVVRLDELQNSKCGRSAIGAQRPILIPIRIIPQIKRTTCYVLHVTYLDLWRKRINSKLIQSDNFI